MLTLICVNANCDRTAIAPAPGWEDVYEPAEGVAEVLCYCPKCATWRRTAFTTKIEEPKERRLFA